MRPPSGTTGSNNKLRVLHEHTYTGCCDTSVELGIKTFLYHYPGHRITLWTLGNWNASGFMDSVDFKNRDFLRTKVFDVREVLPDMPKVWEYFDTKLDSVVGRSDFMRYALIYAYGGTYADLDALATRTPSLVYETATHVVNISPSLANTPTGITCERQPKRDRCIHSNGVYFRFAPGHPWMRHMLEFISTKSPPCNPKGFFCFGPEWTTRRFTEADAGPLITRKRLIKYGLKNMAYEYHTLEYLFTHHDFDTGDIDCSKPPASAYCKAYGVTQRHGGRSTVL